MYQLTLSPDLDHGLCYVASIYEVNVFLIWTYGTYKQHAVMEYIAIVFQKRGHAPERQKLEHHKTYNKTVMNKQNTHKKLPIVSPGLVTNLPQGPVARRMVRVNQRLIP